VAVMNKERRQSTSLEEDLVSTVVSRACACRKQQKGAVECSPP
jgi:hypothetical protein